MTLVLASSSPIRRAMLESAGLALEIVPARIDEAEATLDAASGSAGQRTEQDVLSFQNQLDDVRAAVAAIGE